MTDYSDCGQHREQEDSAIDSIIMPAQKDLGGFSVNRVIPSASHAMIGPWVFFDHLGPVTFAPGKGIDVRPHPHINLATVTFLFDGEMFHRDSLGNAQAIEPGDINLMVAGSGIVHSERERPEMQETERTLHALQLWLALPEKDEETEPAFYHYEERLLPSTMREGVRIRIMMGEAHGLTSPVHTFADTLYVEYRMDQGQSVTLPKAQCRAIYVAEGEVQIGTQTIKRHQMAVLNENDALVVSNQSALMVLVGGEKMPPRYKYWNFVSSSKDRIEKAKADWKAGRFDVVPGDEDEYIPLPD